MLLLGPLHLAAALELGGVTLVGRRHRDDRHRPATVRNQDAGDEALDATGHDSHRNQTVDHDQAAATKPPAAIANPAAALRIASGHKPEAGAFDDF